ncbi:GNAT family N-acetyltransferase [Virgibacillus salexigens]|uniref:Acetyltransferase n=1 Tax=Virgibacillus kapii TaxID=1638645 RepID=A0ABQ2DCZ2_9BACI|nr:MULTISPECIES: GNAT family N-acetyltransferase [Virgibacillus]MYL40968.1 GNAT family N-acetyltransferase [Virgibacillus massiliensis]GGJ53197.1 acetyltransferase [Virgibacillus kapii]
MKNVMTASIELFIQKTERLLLKQEACNNLMLGILHRLKTYRTECQLGWVEEDGEAIYAYLRTPPHNWILPAVASIDLDVIHLIVGELDKRNLDVPGVLGPDKYATAFAKEWEKRTGDRVVIHMKELIYQLDQVQLPLPTSGQLILAKEDDYTLLYHWLVAFGKEANEKITQSRAKTLATEFIRNQSAYFWQVDNQKVSMANKSRQTKHGATINAVYTPDEFKRNGFATSIVTALSYKFLDQGFQFCCLFTDKRNPTSNRIYKRIGYKEIGSAIVYECETG